MKYLFAMAALFFSLFCIAEEPLCQHNNDNCIGVGQWQVSVAVGAGVLTNPLSGGDNLPLLVVPYVSYYRDKFFLENTTMGYTFAESTDFDLSVITEPNTEQAFFERFHIRNLIAPGTYGTTEGNIVSESDVTVPVTPERVVSIDDIAKRRWALDSGLLGHWYLSENSKVSLQWLHDISGTYQGSHVKAAYHYQMKPLENVPIKLHLMAGVHWKDGSLVNYYYGLHERDGVDESLFYSGESVLTPVVGATINYKLSDDWVVKLSMKRQFLGSGIKNSPLIEKSHVTYLFVGGVYAF
ncbi:outer membrane protein [Pseudoalteromonas citrea]|uniref:Outer membrane protein n=2 Tax=Pseudoalteromonas citrea TaxID=43655 RepID=A0AAD4AEZ6_9GAMM|nr:MipA/OmpV family protein [Pseudoalteromonas citrea]KAF7764725.1 outer membrane protein [Pseudoalteromonas citrea]